MVWRAARGADPESRGRDDSRGSSFSSMVGKIVLSCSNVYMAGMGANIMLFLRRAQAASGAGATVPPASTWRMGVA